MQLLLWICITLSIANYAGGLSVTQDLVTDDGYVLITTFQLYNKSLGCTESQICEECCPSTNSNNPNCIYCQKCINLTDCKAPNTMLLTATQIAMSGALIVGILTIFVLFWKICTASYSRRPQRRRNGRRGRNSSRSDISVDSLQQVIIDRLRDAPPSYTQSTLPPPGDTPPPYSSVSSGIINPCFDPDSNAPPPTYTSIIEQENAVSTHNRRNSNKTDVDLTTVELPKETDDSPDPTLHI